MTVSLVLLGSQRRRPTLQDAIRSCDVRGRIAAITAGWEEQEDDDHDLHDHLEGLAFNLHLHARADEVFTEDPSLYDELYAAYQQERRLQEMYRLRLAHALDSVRALGKLTVDAELLDPEVEDALEVVRRLDRVHLERVKELHEEKWGRIQPEKHDAVARHREEIRDELKDCEALCIAGGHVAILLNRMHLFDILGLWGKDRPIFAWSAGAMVLSERIVLFHDSPPQGPGNAEVFQPGLGRAPGLIPLPLVRDRLRLDDPDRVRLLTRRMLPFRCLALSEGTRIDRVADEWVLHSRVRELMTDGTVQDVGTVPVDGTMPVDGTAQEGDAK